MTDTAHIPPGKATRHLVADFIQVSDLQARC